MAQKKFLFILLLAFVLAACSPDHPGRQVAGTPVITRKVTTSSISSPLTVSGNVEGSRTVRLGFMVGGRIAFVGPDEGEYVDQGELVARLDSVKYSIAQSMADVEVRQARDEYNRLKLMHERNSISESDFKKAGFALENALNKQRLQAKNLADTRLYSPIDGVLLKKIMEVGEITGKGTPVLVISDISKVKVNAYVPEDGLHTIQLGEEAEVTISSIDSTFTGTITEIGSAADPETRTFTIRIEVDNPQHIMRPGMIAEAKLGTSQRRQITAIPAEAIMHDIDNQAYVFVVDPGRDRAFKRKVHLGQIVKNQVEITSGLTEGESIVTGGQHKLANGSSITISNE